jgi:ubiquinone biosynthesis protein COQ4
MRSAMRADAEGRQVLRDRPRIRSDAPGASLDRLERLPEASFGRAYWRYLQANAFDPNERHEVGHLIDRGGKERIRAPGRTGLAESAAAGGGAASGEYCAPEPSTPADEAELEYVMQRYREVHDLWHTLYGLPASVSGELALKWIELRETGLPVAALSALVGPLRLAGGALRHAARAGDEASVPAAQLRIFRSVYLPWVLQDSARRAGATSGAAPSSYKALMAIYYERRFERPLDDVRHELGIVPVPMQ